MFVQIDSILQDLPVIYVNVKKLTLNINKQKPRPYSLALASISVPLFPVDSLQLSNASLCPNYLFLDTIAPLSKIVT